MNGYWLAACILDAALLAACITDLILKARKKTKR